MSFEMCEELLSDMHTDMISLGPHCSNDKKIEDIREEAMSDGLCQKCPNGTKAVGFGYGKNFKPLLAGNC
ncbi:hypothetical protein L596_019735 [Steinernema carpocapsae]|uniref:Uncharacterized protein n=1 Tax=Steinernema carpocapsae TaxID=34508 RepID=A0A4U5MRG2_STECR|nr:hypothetical protein L596_019735 [Steinernema carpocapsae]